MIRTNLGTGVEIGLTDRRLYAVTAILVLGNVLLPMAIHQVPGAGRAFMPIFFFTMIAGWRFGLQAALLTAILSPLSSYLITGMPAASKLVSMIASSMLLGGLATMIARLIPRPGIGALALIVLLHRALLSIPFMMTVGAGATFQYLLGTWPGAALHILVGYAVLRLLDLFNDA